MAYDDATAQQIDQTLDAAYNALVSRVVAGDYDTAKTEYMAAVETAAQLVSAGGNVEATKSLVRELGAHQRVTGLLKQLRSEKLTTQEKFAALAEATLPVRQGLFRAYGKHVSSPNEDTRDQDESLTGFRLEKLVERIR
ncbi:hypothetical protein HYS50_02715 [Candidatus Woesearchaeota archaeon]|nr:hypothetical protein [Candidatus Woesearchaeota archaeon]